MNEGHQLLQAFTVLNAAKKVIWIYEKRHTQKKGEWDRDFIHIGGGAK